MESSPSHKQSGTPLLRSEQLRVTYGLTRALDGVDLTVERGDSIAIIGSSGSGKSTLLHCLSGLVAPSEGRAWFTGRDLNTMSDAERSALRRQRFGFVFQFGHLVPELTALENVSLNLRLNGVGRGPAEETARSWLRDLGVEELARRRPGEMSGGQQQRVAVARALAPEPDVIFADEPTGALDTANGELVLDLLVQQVRNRRCALVLVTHDDKIAAYAEREVVLRDGRVVPPATGAPR
ncbi:ABC transporter ATP-binding protein [Micromonospora endolithica]|uniref:ABC transporter ATP-binding protein n=1 Tax=Micromonospora endolithica TaxID=230091 RepID=A0A3A9YRR5_9ACTN|nr:ABC transporter ATP-binding protein [Micromonospora endolithica]RKN38703.1 ABC transporter ATP-binding protein [Micromonospora endolithica]TWJ25291.1 putative ABC transport system ATP-binding protein [Micromonospora endolithica]